ncbi:GMC oxidoreductase [Zopfia rhizophila CBS 207.26]|uniref:GMC oxidoreductase n=1 Tax=Zopfia rhizophila CBS 207.26 TaxID=1314779 RepID=A0A6A6EE17_9PEZI|nr:GMC oxidoreductase [Zopfia rhizophila CBS 207.26]
MNMRPIRTILQPLAISALPALASETFDYIIVGGGTAGLVLANRLSSNLSITVAVIEAGDSVLDNPNVTDVSAFGLAFGSSIDWAYTSAPQKYAGNRTLTYDAGKALGGTSTINGMTYLRAEKEQIDQWEELGNEGWNWESLWPYYLKHEGFLKPDYWQVERGATFEKEVHGFEGPVGVGWSKHLIGQGVESILRGTSEALGIPFNADANDGSMRGFTTWPFTLNASTNIREDAARAYYWSIPPESRPNLRVYLNTTATRIIWDPESKIGKVQASGVEVLTSTNSKKFISITTDGEVILSTGSIRSPALLELSGIGNPAILEPLGIKTIIPLPSVGNLHDQSNTLMSYSSSAKWTGYPSFVTYVTASDLFGTHLNFVSDSLRANISRYAETIVSDSAPNATSVSILKSLLQKQVNLIFKENSSVPLAELLWVPSANAISVAFWNLLPFSLGSIHITSANPTIPPSINPNYWQLEIDILVQSAAAMKIREYFSTPPLSEYVSGEISPNFTVVPQDARFDDTRWGDWLKGVSGSNMHQVGTCAMKNRELGGVVDIEGRVYGALNVRVVDASVIPEQVSGHLSATVYAVAERIVEGILKGR